MNGRDRFVLPLLRQVGRSADCRRMANQLFRTRSIGVSHVSDQRQRARGFAWHD